MIWFDWCLLWNLFVGVLGCLVVVDFLDLFALFG